MNYIQICSPTRALLLFNQIQRQSKYNEYMKKYKYAAEQGLVIDLFKYKHNHDTTWNEILIAGYTVSQSFVMSEFL